MIRTSAKSLVLRICFTLLAASALAWFGYADHHKMQKLEREKAALLSQAAPDLTPISDFDARLRDKTLTEAHISARWVAEYNTQLVTKRRKSSSETVDGAMVF